MLPSLLTKGNYPYVDERLTRSCCCEKMCICMPEHKQLFMLLPHVPFVSIYGCTLALVATQLQFTAYKIAQSCSPCKGASPNHFSTDNVIVTLSIAPPPHNVTQEHQTNI